MALFGAPRMQRLLRYCARPIFAGERLTWVKPGQRLAYCLPKPRPDGQIVLYLTPLEWLDRVAVLIPPPRRHRHWYHGVLAPNAPLRVAVTARAGLPVAGPPSLGHAGAPLQAATEAREELDTTPRPRASYLWAMLLARIYEVFPLSCLRCGEPMRIIAFVTEVDPIQRILEPLGEPLQPPPIASARGPPHWEEDADQREVAEVAMIEPLSTYEFDQRVSW